MLIDHHRFALYNFCPDVRSFTSPVKFTEFSSPATYLHRVMFALADLRAWRKSWYRLYRVLNMLTAVVLTVRV